MGLPCPDWKPARLFLEAAGPTIAAKSRRLSALLEQSRQRLRPLSDPFDLDLGLHRWLADDREEAYSDWLEWVVRQIHSPRAVFRMLDIKDPPDLADWEDSTPHTFEREHTVPHGNEGQEGRLDLFIQYGNRVLIVVEVKKTGAKGAATEKHVGYTRSIRELYSDIKQHHFLFLTTSDDKAARVDGFEPRAWRAVCIELRRTAVSLIANNRVLVAALVLAFVAAVEQNLLGFSASVAQQACENSPLALLFSSQIAEYLGQALKE